MRTYTFDRNPVEGMTIYSPEFLATLDTLHTGHFENLKLETGGLRYWLSRVAEEEGSGGWQVNVDKLAGLGHWVELLKYKCAEQEA